MNFPKVFFGAAVMTFVLSSGGCFVGSGSGVNHNDAQVTGDASMPGGGSISIYLTGDLTPKTFTDGLQGQTPTSYLIALSEYWVQTSLSDPAPVFCFDAGAAPVVADLQHDTLIGVCQTQDIPTAEYTHGRVKVDWVTYTVHGTLHYQNMPLPGEFTFFRAYSDTTYNGDSYQAGQGTIAFAGATQVTIPYSFDPPLSLPGVNLETIAGEFWMTFPYSQPLVVDQSNTNDHWARAHWEIFEGFRWQDDTTPGYTAGIWDVGVTVGETEEVFFAGVTGYHTTASTD